ncbi:hypothetical protein BC567DRAFT_39061 [Phyllosticta citribraziliensis]
MPPFPFSSFLLAVSYFLYLARHIQIASTVNSELAGRAPQHSTADMFPSFSRPISHTYVLSSEAEACVGVYSTAQHLLDGTGGRGQQQQQQQR